MKKMRNMLPRLSLFVGMALLLFLPLLIYFSTSSLHVQERHTTAMLQERGESLVHSLESAARSSLALRSDSRGRVFFLQKLVWETAQQNDVDHIIVTNNDGVIIADSDPAQVGGRYGLDMPLAERISPGKRSRRTANANGSDTYEVFGALNPFGLSPDKGLVVFIGLDTRRYEEARIAAKQETVRRGVIIFVVGVCGLLLLGMVASFYATRRSLNSLQVLSAGIAANIPVGLLVLDNVLEVTVSNEEGQRCAALKVVASEKTLLEDIRSNINKLDQYSPPQKFSRDLADGEMTVEIAITRYRDNKGNGYIVIVGDVSSVKKMERQVAGAQRLATLGNFAAGIAHEIRNPLSSIKGFTTFFAEKYKNDDANGKIAGILNEEVARLNRVLNDVLDFARLENIKKEKCDVGALAREATDLLVQNAAAMGVRLVCHCEPDLRKIRASPDKIHQAFFNLIINGIQASGANGVVAVTIKSSAAGVRIDFSDTGKGIKAGDERKIFEPYYTTKAGGSGLGLAITKEIVEAHGGEIRAGNVSGGGAIFTVILPWE